MSLVPRTLRPATALCWLVGLTALLWGAAVAPAQDQAAATTAAGPNVILIVADDLGAADLGCYGSRYHQTPQLDQMAKDGLRLTSAYSAAPVCSPTRAALLTGKHPARLHLTDWLPGRPNRPDQPLNRPQFRQELPLEEVTLAERFHAAGYATGHIGKWHLGGAGFGPLQQGFDSNIAGDHTGTPLSYIAPFRNQERFMPGLEQAPDGEYLTDRLTAEAVTFINAHRERPFFLYLPHYTPHTPLTARPDLQAKWEAKERPSAPGAQANPIYGAMLESLDEGVGKIRQALEAAGIAQNTLVLFTSDNGGLSTLEGPRTPSTANAPHREGKGFLYEGGIRIPLLAVWPGQLAAGQSNNTPVVSHDLVPTLAALCGLPTPEGVDGVSLAGHWLKGEAAPVRDLHWHYPHYSNQRARPGAAIRRGSRKLVEFFETGRRELFDVEKDPSESRNLAGDSPTEVEELATALHAWQERVGAQSMTANPEFVPNPQGADGVVLLPAKNARVEGIMLRYEPLPHKETLGFWVRESDWASWEFTIREPGRFAIEILQGCGPGSGGSTVEFQVGDQVVPMTVEETKGFQDFRRRTIGELTVKEAGRHTLTVKPVKKPGVAVMDLREIKLVPLR